MERLQCTNLGGIHRWGEMRTITETRTRIDFETTCLDCGYIDCWWTANVWLQLEEARKR